MDCPRCEKTHEKCEHCGLRNPQCRRYRCGMCWRLLCNYCCEGEDVLPRERVKYCTRRDERTPGNPPSNSCTERGIGIVAALLIFKRLMEPKIDPYEVPCILHGRPSGTCFQCWK